ncbi:hypothetical protein THAOC_28782 [Thalassiosira oceanica]|uniref:Uncharacterized protein n=1 Tax=Thalassiosira oceanica TaxID=159749 RepID=K0RST7_THAOC|nr:hypothetical protein THAOC_28782 [Thalassiosira oceanica]|eukprot:EJK51991.1 hypothetical protein THAOC_28782 [Thalassiosira oceanica]
MRKTRRARRRCPWARRRWWGAGAAGQGSRSTWDVGSISASRRRRVAGESSNATPARFCRRTTIRPTMTRTDDSVPLNSITDTARRVWGCNRVDRADDSVELNKIQRIQSSAVPPRLGSTGVPRGPGGSRGHRGSPADDNQCRLRQ